MKDVPLTKGHVAQVDDQDYERVMQFKWCANVHKRKDGTIRAVYGIRGQWNGTGYDMIYLHRFIVGVTDPAIDVDHHDHNGLHNWRENLRVCNSSQNTANARISAANTSGRKGVCWKPHAKKWQAQITVNRKNHHLGYFNDIESAAAAYEAAAIANFGEFAHGDAR